LEQLWEPSKGIKFVMETSSKSSSFSKDSKQTLTNGPILEGPKFQESYHTQIHQKEVSKAIFLLVLVGTVSGWECIPLLGVISAAWSLRDLPLVCGATLPSTAQIFGLSPGFAVNLWD